MTLVYYLEDDKQSGKRPGIFPDIQHNSELLYIFCSGHWPLVWWRDKETKRIIFLPGFSWEEVGSAVWAVAASNITRRDADVYLRPENNVT